ncbi:MAG: hypothetical protein ABIQ32_12110 [Sphingomicrobium sp.]
MSPKFWIAWLGTMVLSLAISAVLTGVVTIVTSASARGSKATLGQALGQTVPVLLPLILFSILLAIAVMLGMLLLFVPGVMLYVAFSVGAQSLVAEQLNIGQAFSRSRSLTKGARWKVFALILILTVMAWLASFLFGLAGMRAAAMSNGFQLSSKLLIASALYGTVVNTVWSTIQASLYVELREWKDGPQHDHLQEVFA